MARTRSVLAGAVLASLFLSAHLVEAGPQPGAALERKPSAEPTEAMLPPVDPEWRGRGWRSVVPHAYVLRSVAPARERPDDAAPAAFWLKGGVRVPVVEQGRAWWKVSWTNGRTGWMRIADLEPHAACVLIDARTGRVQRRFATKGQWGAVADGNHLWTLANTGLTRISLDPRPAFWSFPVRMDRDGMLPYESIWAPDRASFLMPVLESEIQKVAYATAATGEVELAEGAPAGQLLRVDAASRVLIDDYTGKSAATVIWDSKQRRELGRLPARFLAAGKEGRFFVSTGVSVQAYEADLTPGPRVSVRTPPEAASLSPDARHLALSYLTKKADGTDSFRIEIRSAETQARRVSLGARGASPYVITVLGGKAGWLVVCSGDTDRPVVTQFTPSGRKVRSWSFAHLSTAGPDDKTLYAARDRDILVLNADTGGARTIPFSWRRPLPSRYLPKPNDPSIRTRLSLSNITLTPDGGTLVATEWLNGDPEG